MAKAENIRGRLKLIEEHLIRIILWNVFLTR